MCVVERSNDLYESFEKDEFLFYTIIMGNESFICTEYTDGSHGTAATNKEKKKSLLCLFYKKDISS